MLKEILAANQFVDPGFSALGVYLTATKDATDWWNSEGKAFGDLPDTDLNSLGLAADKAMIAKLAEHTAEYVAADPNGVEENYPAFVYITRWADMISTHIFMYAKSEQIKNDSLIAKPGVGGSNNLMPWEDPYGQKKKRGQ